MLHNLAGITFYIALKLLRFAIFLSVVSVSIATVALSYKFMAPYYLKHQYVSLFAILRKSVTMHAGTSIYNFDF